MLKPNQWPSPSNLDLSCAYPGTASETLRVYLTLQPSQSKG